MTERERSRSLASILVGWTSCSQGLKSCPHWMAIMAPGQYGVGEPITLPWLDYKKFVVSRIVQGGMGTVYQLVPVGPGYPTVALKTLQASIDPAIFERECEIWLKASDHPGIAKAMKYGELDGRPTILSIWYPHTLADQELSGWPTDKLSNFVSGLIDALGYLHSQHHVIHQDIKPSNILLNGDLAPRLTDFGLVRALKAATSFNEGALLNRDKPTTVGTIGGTPLYMAPELFDRALPSVVTDIFSLGVTLYEAITGHHPYVSAKGISSQADMQRLASTLRNHGDLGQRLGSAIASAIAIEPTRRPQNCARLLELMGSRIVYAGESEIAAEGKAIAVAAMYRQQGKYEAAQATLTSALNAMPENPAIINALGALAIAMKDVQTGVRFYEIASKLLIERQGLHRGQVYPDPIVNLSWQLICLDIFDEAHGYLRVLWDWLVSSGSKRSSRILSYPEFGFMFLFEGRFEEAWDWLNDYANENDPPDMALVWLTLATWLGNRTDARIERLFQLLSGKRPLNLRLALCVCLFASLNKGIGSKQFLSLIGSDAIAELTAIEGQYNLGKGGLRPPASKEALLLILRSLDAWAGGKNDEHFG